MSCSVCRGFNVSFCPCCSEPPAGFEEGLDLLGEIREDIFSGEINHADQIQDRIFAHCKSMNEVDQDGFSDYAWGELAEFQNLGDDPIDAIFE